MKSKFILFAVLQFTYFFSFCQYIGVKARYAATRTVNNLPFPPSRENQLVLSFYSVSPGGAYTPISLSNYDIWIYKEGLPYSGIPDSQRNNYPEYAKTAPMVLAYYNSYIPNYIDCDGSLTTHFILNGHELDCGFIRVSHWDRNPVTDLLTEIFTAPNVCLPYYFSPDPYALAPGNVNFTNPPVLSTGYNHHFFNCGIGPQQEVIRGVIPHEAALSPLPILLSNVKATLNAVGTVRISWSNLTESNIKYYEVEKAANGNSFQPITQLLPKLNNGSRVDYEILDITANLQAKILYRIKVVENDGNYLYSSILIIINNSSETNLTVYPNPVFNNQLNFQVTNLPRGHYSIVLMNALGQVTLLKEIIHNGSSITQALDLFNLPSGLYDFMIRSQDKILSKKIIIKN